MTATVAALAWLAVSFGALDMLRRSARRNGR